MRIISRTAGSASTQVVRHDVMRKTERLVDDLVAVEEPLEIRLNHRPVSVTMRTPGDDGELAAGFLVTEGILKDRGDLDSVESEGNIVNVTSRRAAVPTPRNFYISSSCGVCGKASIEAIHAAGAHSFRMAEPCIEHEVLIQLPGRLREAQNTFEETGGLHAAALFDSTGSLLCLKEDIGRHNAVDKVVGTRWLENLPPGAILLVSGRAGFELVQKAAVAGVPVIAAIGAPSTLAIELAEELGMSLIGFLREGRFNVYVDTQRRIDRYSFHGPTSSP